MSQSHQEQQAQLAKLAEWWQSYSQAISAYTNQNQPQPGAQSGPQAPNVASSPVASSATSSAQYYGGGSAGSTSLLGTAGGSPGGNQQYAEFYTEMEKYYTACANFTQNQGTGSYNSSYNQQPSGGGSGGGSGSSGHYSPSPTQQQQGGSYGSPTGYSSPTSYGSNWRGRTNDRGASRGWSRGGTNRSGYSRGAWRHGMDHWGAPSGAPGQDTLKTNPEDVYDWWGGQGGVNSEAGFVGGHMPDRSGGGGGNNSRQHDIHREDHRQQHDAHRDDHHSDRYHVREGDRWSHHGGKSPRSRWDDDRGLHGGVKTRSTLPEHPSHTPPKRISDTAGFRSASAHIPTDVESLVQQQIQQMMSPLLAKSATVHPTRQFTVQPTNRDKQMEPPHPTDSHGAGGREHASGTRSPKGNQKRDTIDASLKAERSSRSRSRSPVRSKLEDGGDEDGDVEKNLNKKSQEDDSDHRTSSSRDQDEAATDSSHGKPTQSCTVPEEAQQSPDSSNKEQPPEIRVEGYDSSKKYGEEYIREVTAFQCFLCGRRFWQQDEVEYHCRSQGHWTNYQKCKLNIEGDDDNENDNENDNNDNNDNNNDNKE